MTPTLISVSMNAESDGSDIEAAGFTTVTVLPVKTETRLVTTFAIALRVDDDGRELPPDDGVSTTGVTQDDVTRLVTEP
jgi:hypothetical protein